MRLADLLAGLSRLADLGFGLPMGTALRSCVLATHLARSLELPPSGVQAAFYTALLHHVGCAGYARETARLFGDELVTNRAAGRTDAASFRDVFKTFLPTLTQGRPVPNGAAGVHRIHEGRSLGRPVRLAPPASSGGTPPGGCNCPRTSRSACSMSTTSGGARLGPERWKARTSPWGAPCATGGHRRLVRVHRRERSRGAGRTTPRRRHARPGPGGSLCGQCCGVAGRPFRRPTRAASFWIWNRTRT